MLRLQGSYLYMLDEVARTEIFVLVRTEDSKRHGASTGKFMRRHSPFESRLLKRARVFEFPTARTGAVREAQG